MSFASEVKKELTTLTVHRENAKAELIALIRMNGSLGLSNHHFILNIQTENPAIARRIYQLLKQFYDVDSELLVRRKMKLKKEQLVHCSVDRRLGESIIRLGDFQGWSTD